jgi:hypothetical protein
VTAFAPQAAGRLLAVCPVVAELLAVMVLGKGILGSVSLHPDSNVAEASQTENFLGLCCPRQSYEEQGQVENYIRKFILLHLGTNHIHTVACVFVASGTFLQSCCLKTVVVYSPIFVHATVDSSGRH